MFYLRPIIPFLSLASPFSYNTSTFAQRLIAFLFLICISKHYAQEDSNLVLTFNFNNHTIEEDHHLLTPRGSNVSLVEDRFGNEKSAILLNGNLYSYLNLGISPLLKTKVITVSLWVNLIRRVYNGKGYDQNPVLYAKNGPQDDFNVAYSIGYDSYSGRFTSGSTVDSTLEAKAIGINKVEFNSWYHLVIAFNSQNFVFYINGKLQGICQKNFETKYLESDSVMIGHTANKKNERYSMGVFDDIRIFHRVLSEQEIMGLYNEPNYNRNRLVFYAVLKWLGIIGGIILVSFLLVWQRRITLSRAKERHELEIRTLKSQMNPHFIFNSLSSIKGLVMIGDNTNAELYLSKFSKLIRELLESNTNEHLTIEEEIKILQGYLEMESLRFDSSFTYNLQLDDKIEATETYIPHFMIQPFVENAIWHGLLTKAVNRNLEIRFEYDTQKTIRCIVDDNGVGRKMSSQKEITFKKKSLALSFVKQRLELMSNIYKVKCSINIIDKTNSGHDSLGTKVIIILPTITIN